MPKYLTNALFTHALHCPTKLYYATNPDYLGGAGTNKFVQALAGGGMQVEELAKLYYPEGNSIKTTDTEEAVLQTEKILEQNDAVIYDAVFRHQYYLSTTDIAEKKGRTLKLIKVIPQAWEPGESFISRHGYNIKKEWQKALYDIAFQFWVAKKAFPDMEIVPCLMLIDKSRHSNVTGLHGKFEVVKDAAGHTVKEKQGITKDDLGNQILREVDVRYEVEKILEGNARKPEIDEEEEGFETWLETLNRHLQDNEKYPAKINSGCMNCEYYLSKEMLKDNKKSGYVECRKEALGLEEEDLSKPNVFDIRNEWDIDKKYLNKEIYLMNDLVPNMLPSNPEGLYKQKRWSEAQRKTVHIMKATGNHTPREVILTGFLDEMKKWKYPFYFINIKAVTAAIPFYKKHYPYEYVPFQFSCHIMLEDGTIEHRADWLAEEAGKLPSIELVRQLKKCFGKDKGTVFTYGDLEHTILSELSGLIKRIKPDDEKELREWLSGLIKEDDRKMVDQERLVKDYYYSSHMGGSTSFRDVVPAVLTESKRLQGMYIKPYNGTHLKDEILYEPDPNTGKAISPFKLLEPLGYGIPDLMEEQLVLNGEPVSGMDTATMAWSRIQFDDLTDEERKDILNALYKKGELDTLAMAMIHQHWRSLFNL